MPTTTASARRAAAVVFVTFLLNGFTFANWLSRIPTIRDELSLRERDLGLIIVAGSLGSVLSLPLAGRVIARIGARATVLIAATLATVGLGVAVSGVASGLPLLLTAGLFVTTMGIGGWDVAMNFAGARVEQALGRAIMPVFHGGFSIGTVAGAALGAVAIRLGIDVPLHVLTVVALALVAVIVLTRGFLPEPPAEPEHDGAAQHRTHLSFARVWLEPRTLMVGLVVLAAALTEGAANDWLALAVVDGFEVSNDVGATGLTIFLVGMTLMRFLGTWLLDRFGRVSVLRLCTALAIVGLAVFCLVPSLPIALGGAVLWGMGAALGFPVGMSAASDEPMKAAARLSVVSTIGYTAFLVGPGALGLLADVVGTRTALLVILVPLAVGLLVIPAARPPQPAAETGAPVGRPEAQTGASTEAPTAQPAAQTGASTEAPTAQPAAQTDAPTGPTADPASRRVAGHEDGG